MQTFTYRTSFQPPWFDCLLPQLFHCLLRLGFFPPSFVVLPFFHLFVQTFFAAIPRKRKCFHLRQPLFFPAKRICIADKHKRLYNRSDETEREELNLIRALVGAAVPWFTPVRIVCIRLNSVVQSVRSLQLPLNSAGYRCCVCSYLQVEFDRSPRLVSPVLPFHATSEVK